ncbi:MAG: hypothetical protein LBQ24_03460 [Candidatus Peribacteria bacterium]|nr:hypothetical protein [Candidatus Peribacteria bacterium]
MVVIFFLYFVFFCLSSCSQDIPDEFLESTIKLDKPSLEVSDIGRIVNLDPQKPKELKYYVDYPVFENSVLSDSIHSYFNNLIAEKERIIETESGDIQNPEIHASFAEYT